MKKKFFYIMGAIICLSVFTGLLVFNPPLDASSSVFHDSDNKKIVIPIGNKGISEINNIEVLVNGNRKPDEAIIQIIHYPSGAFRLSTDIEDGEVKALVDFNLPAGTGINKRLESENDDSLAYALTVSSNPPITEVTIKYRYFGVQFSESFRFY